MESTPSCCAGGRSATNDLRENPPEGASALPESTVPATGDDDRTTGMVKLNGGQFLMGTDSDVGFPEDGEGPTREVTIDPFYIDRHAVTNAEFIEFVQETGYTTDAERFGWSFVFENFCNDADRERLLRHVDAAPWWVAVEGAAWLYPNGPAACVLDNRELLKHPVTHVSWRDVAAYADWAGKRLPTEAEWEYAARGGHEQRRFPWGDRLAPDGEFRCNTWQGEFPDHNTGADGHVQTAPVDAFQPNDYGLYNVVGNVWEWCMDWFSPDYHTTEEYDHHNPRGPESGVERIMRGGSHLCHRSWCNRYRLGARSKNTPDSSTGNIGFRCVVDTAGR